jgi:hypothetical protein
MGPITGRVVVVVVVVVVLVGQTSAKTFCTMQVDVQIL